MENENEINKKRIIFKELSEVFKKIPEYLENKIIINEVIFDLKEFCEVFSFDYSDICQKIKPFRVLVKSHVEDEIATKYIKSLDFKFNVNDSNKEIKEKSRSVKAQFENIEIKFKNVIFEDERIKLDFEHYGEELNLTLEQNKNINTINKKIFNTEGKLIGLKPIANYTEPRIIKYNYFDGQSTCELKKLITNRHEVDLLDKTYAFYDFMNAVKPSGNTNVASMVEEYASLYDYIINNYDPEDVVDKTIAYGYYGKGKAIYRGWEQDSNNLRAKDFKDLLETEYSEDEVKQLLIQLNEYMADDLSKIIFEYGLVSIFRYDLMNRRMLDLFPNLVVVGSRGKGKTQRIDTIYSKLFLNTSQSYMRDDFKGSLSKQSKEQYVNMPIWVDELKEYPTILVDMIKKLGTTKENIISRGNKDVSKENHEFKIFRPFIISTNSFSSPDHAMTARFKIIDVDDIKLVNTELIGKKIVKNVHKIGAFIYDNIEMLEKVVDSLEFSPSRNEAIENTFMIGRELAKAVFKFAGINYVPSEQNYASDDIVIEQKDRVKLKIIDEIKKITSYTQSGNKIDIFNYILDYTDEEIEKNLSKIGAYIVLEEHEHRLLITQNTLSAINLLEFQIKTLSNLKENGFEVKPKRVGVEKSTKKVCIIPLMSKEFIEGQQNIEISKNYDPDDDEAGKETKPASESKVNYAVQGLAMQFLDEANKLINTEHRHNKEINIAEFCMIGMLKGVDETQVIEVTNVLYHKGYIDKITEYEFRVC